MTSRGDRRDAGYPVKILVNPADPCKMSPLGKDARGTHVSSSHRIIHQLTDSPTPASERSQNLSTTHRPPPCPLLQSWASTHPTAFPSVSSRPPCGRPPASPANSGPLGSSLQPPYRCSRSRRCRRTRRGCRVSRTSDTARSEEVHGAW